jgi:hypothetical protein
MGDRCNLFALFSNLLHEMMSQSKAEICRIYPLPRCIESVAELCKRFPDSVLVRDNVRAFVSKSDDVDAITREAKSRTICEGETLILVGEASGGSKRFLRCFDQNGENVFLPHELRGRFSAIAKEDNISGVHTAANLLNKRLPVMARLVSPESSSLPVSGCNGDQMKTVSSFAPEMRMLAALEEDLIVGLVLQGSKECNQVVPIPLPALIKVQSPSNHDAVSTMPEFERLVERCQELSQDLVDRMTTHDVGYARDLRLNGADKTGLGGMHHFISSNNNINNNNNVVTSNLGTNQRRKSRSRNFFLSSSNNGGAATSNGGVGKIGPRDEYDEIEQIYDYVRGFAPLPKSAKGWYYENTIKRNSKDEDEMTTGTGSGSRGSGSHNSRQLKDTSVPPVPPPIETIPSLQQHHNVVPMEFSSSATPPLTPPAGAPMSTSAMWSENGEVYSATLNGYHSKESKKRHRSRNNVTDENAYPTLNSIGGTSRFIKSATAPHRMMSGPTNVTKHKFFRQRSVPKDAPPPVNLTHHPMMSMTLSRSNLYNPNGSNLKSSSPASFFHLRYKSLTNLAAHAEYDTLESSNSGGKTSGGADSGGSRTLPEKRSRRVMSRPKSLTNLVWGNSSSRQNVVVNKETSGGGGGGGSRGFFHGFGSSSSKKPTAVKSHHQAVSGVGIGAGAGGTLLHHGSKLGGRGGKKVGTLYL